MWPKTLKMSSNYQIFTNLIDISHLKATDKNLSIPSGFQIKVENNVNVITSNAWVVKLSWLANDYSHPVLAAGALDE